MVGRVELVAPGAGRLPAVHAVDVHGFGFAVLLQEPQDAQATAWIAPAVVDALIGQVGWPPDHGRSAILLALEVLPVAVADHGQLQSEWSWSIYWLWHPCGGTCLRTI